jgi:hypothetical protein
LPRHCVCPNVFSLKSADRIVIHLNVVDHRCFGRCAPAALQRCYAAP